MIITQRAANLSYGTDPVAASLRSVIAASAAQFAPHGESAVTGGTPLDLEALYPALFKAAPVRSSLVRTMQAAAFRLSLVGMAAALLAILHH